MKIIYWHRIILAGGAVAFLMVLLAQPHEAAAAAAPLLVRETEAQLVAAGCERVKVADDKATKAAGALDWQAVVPADATGETLTFCPPLVISGQVAGLINEARADVNMNYEDFAQQYAKGENEDWNWVVNLLAKLLSVLFRIIAAVGVYLLNKVVNFLPLLLTQSNFVNSGLVRDIWPIVLGITNGGFLLALVLIALLTVLRLDVGGGVRRLLPRLLIAALLINFSLVIAGLILDASRVVMAMTVPLMGLSSIDDLPVKIINIASNWKFNLELDIADVKEMGEKGGTVGEDTAPALAELSETASNDVNLAIRGLVQAVVVWVALGAVLVVIVGLLVRYVALIFLLILSPAAYLFMAFPGAVDLARKWWSTFLRYVVYGPIVLAFLILAVKSAEKLTELHGDIDLVDDPAFKQAFILVIFCTFLVLGAVAGRYAGILGSAAAISVATGAGRRARGMAYRGARGTGKAAARGVYVGTGARAGVRALGRQARDFGGAIKGGIVARLPEAFKPVKRDKQGRPIPGQAPTWGQRLGRGLAGRGYTDKQETEAQSAAAFRISGATDEQRAKSINDAGAVSSRLMQQRHVVQNVSGDEAGEMLENKFVKREVRVAVAGDVDAIRKILATPDADVTINAALNLNTDANLPTNLRMDTGDDTKDAANADQNEKNRKENERRRNNKEVVTALRKTLAKINNPSESQQA